NQIVSPPKLERLADLQQRQEVMVAVDNPAVVPVLGQAARRRGAVLPVVLELDIGMHRAGVQPGLPALGLARAAASTPGVRLCGLMGYEGHVLAVEPPEEKVRQCHQALDLLLQTRDLLLRDGLPCPVVSAGGTGCYAITAAYPGITEVQAGGGVFMDAMYRKKFGVTGLGCALTVLTTVTSQAAQHVVVDAGFKALSAYHHPPFVAGRDDLELRYLSAEHGVFAVRPGGVSPSLGERLHLVVGYSDSTDFLHDRFLATRAGRVERVWEIKGRGCLT
ncbi:MAG: alanine racemase, partial [Candidatus Latescibacterota bacterium]